MPHVSVLCTSFRPGGIDILLAGMGDQTFKDFEVILVDRRYERRHEGVLEMAAERNVDLIHVPEHRRNGKWAGIGSAWNTAMAVADGEVFIFLPDWTYAPPGWIEAHLSWRAGRVTTYTAAPYRYTALPQLGVKKVFDFSNQNDRGANCTDWDDVLNGLVFEELSAFMNPFTGLIATRLKPHGWPHQDVREAGPGQSLHPTWLHIKNESIHRDMAFAINGLDERLDRGKGPLDIDWGYRLYAAGGHSAWAPEAMAFCPNPRWVCGSMPWGHRDERVEGRWSYHDGVAYNERRLADCGRGDYRAKNPFDMHELRTKLLAAGWRDKARVIDIAPLDVDDLTYFGQEIWPETP